MILNNLHVDVVSICNVADHFTGIVSFVELGCKYIGDNKLNIKKMWLGHVLYKLPQEVVNKNRGLSFR